MWYDKKKFDYFYQKNKQEALFMFKIVEKKSLNPTVTKMVVEAPLIAKKAEPGQFIILSCERGQRKNSFDDF